MNQPVMSESTEMYLKAMLELGEHDVAIARLAERLGVTSVSASEMMRRLGEQGLVTHVPYKGVTLSRKGHEVAANVIRRQRLWERFLFDHLHIEWSKIYDLACSLEHATAPEVTEALAIYLGHPQTCPSGNPIPDVNGKFAPVNGRLLSEMKINETSTILAVTATHADVLKYLQEKNLLPGRKVTLLEIAPLQGPLTLLIDNKEIALGLVIANYIIVG